MVAMMSWMPGATQALGLRQGLWGQLSKDERNSQTTTLTCGIAGTPDCSHLSSWGLLPDHGPKIVLVTNLMGLCKGPDSEVDRSEGLWHSVLPDPSEPECSGKGLTRTSLSATLSVLVLGALAGCSPKERPRADTLPSLASTSTRDTAAAP